MLAYFKNKNVTKLFNEYNKMIVSRNIPVAAKKVKMVMIPKNTSEFRPIAITEPSKLLLDKITARRLRGTIKISRQKICFKDRRSIADHIINLEALIRETRTPIMVELDIQKAYNLVNRGKLY